MTGVASPPMPTNFIELYRLAAGRWFEPPVFHLWSGMALMAAAVEDRVGLDFVHGSPLHPNLYVMLIGPAACGKNLAIDLAARYAHDSGAINTFMGSITKAGLEDHLTKPFRPKAPTGSFAHAKLFLVTPELALSVGGATQADELIRFLTDIYTGKPIPATARTRTHGLVTMVQPTVTWLSGTTPEWLRHAIPKATAESGFLSRVVPVVIEDDVEKRQLRPTYPVGVEWMRDALRTMLLHLTTVSGEMKFTPQAERMAEAWVRERPSTTDPRIKEWWNRQDTLAWKLAMLLSLADGNTMQIGTRHVVQGLELAASIKRDVAIMATELSATPDTLDIRKVVRVLRKVRRVRLTQLQKIMHSYGMTAFRLDLALRSLEQSGESVRKQVTETKRWWVLWVAPEATGESLGDGRNGDGPSGDAVTED